ncbi:hypothetical protein [Brachyspira murdochii]|uniref:hypothetical protein n=1 Tax=Brachyspira murdochii TaxID=84378 RepID=UPI0030061548
MKNLLKKIKLYRVFIAIYILSILLGILDLIFNFHIAKCIVYIVMFFITLLNIVDYIKLMNEINKKNK